MSNGIDLSSITAPAGSVEFYQQVGELAASLKEQIPGIGETLKRYADSVCKDLGLPPLPPPATGISTGGLSLETLMDMVGFETRRTETKSGVATLKAHAEQREKVNQEKIEKLEEQLSKGPLQKVLDGFLKAFKYIGMALAAIGSIAMIAGGAAACLAGGSGAALIAVGVLSLVTLASSITEEATEGKVGFTPGFLIGKAVEAGSGDKEAAMWTKLAIDLTATIVLAIASCGASSSTVVGNLTMSTAQLEKIQSVATSVARFATIAGAGNSLVQGGFSIGNAVNERDIAYLKAQQKRLDAILQRISVANDVELEHIKKIMEQTSDNLETVSNIVKEGVETNTALTTGMPPSMA